MSSASPRDHAPNSQKYEPRSVAFTALTGYRVQHILQGYYVNLSLSNTSWHYVLQFEDAIRPVLVAGYAHKLTIST